MIQRLLDTFEIALTINYNSSTPISKRKNTFVVLSRRQRLFPRFQRKTEPANKAAVGDTKRGKDEGSRGAVQSERRQSVFSQRTERPWLTALRAADRGSSTAWLHLMAWMWWVTKVGWRVISGYLQQSVPLWRWARFNHHKTPNMIIKKTLLSAYFCASYSPPLLSLFCRTADAIEPDNTD